MMTTANIQHLDELADRLVRINNARLEGVIDRSEWQAQFARLTWDAAALRIDIDQLITYTERKFDNERKDTA